MHLCHYVRASNLLSREFAVFVKIFVEDAMKDIVEFAFEFDVSLNRMLGRDTYYEANTMF